MLSVSDEDNNELFIGENNEMHGQFLEMDNKTSYSLMDAAIKSPDTSFVLEPVREEPPRQNKLSRFRTPLNNQKNKDLNSSNVLLAPFNTTSSNSTGNEANSRTSEFGLAHTVMTMSLEPTKNNDNVNCLALKRMDGSQITQDGITKITLVQSAVTSFANSVSNFEPELVLSPAKLGQ